MRIPIIVIGRKPGVAQNPNPLMTLLLLAAVAMDWLLPIISPRNTVSLTLLSWKRDGLAEEIRVVIQLLSVPTICGMKVRQYTKSRCSYMKD